MSITQTITALPTPPDPDDPTTFDDRAYAFTDAQVDMATELNAMISQINSTEADMNTSAANAAASASDAQTFAENARLYSEYAASSAQFQGAWSSSTTYALGDSCSYNRAIWRSLVAGNLNHIPAAGSVYWVETWRQNNMEYGQCVLRKVGSNLVLYPYNGNQLFINGAYEKLPGACILPVTGLAANTLYYIYAYMSGSTVTLEASTTTYAIDSTNGQEIKNGDPTRSLVGMAKTITGPAWADTATRRYVRSWYNRDIDGAAIYNAITSDYTFSSAAWAEIDASTIKSVLCWDKEIATVRCICSYYNTTSYAQHVGTGVGIDSVRLSPSSIGAVAASSYGDLPLEISLPLTNGEHTFHLYGYTSSTGVRCQIGSHISVEIR